jgi:hypothetical protein
VEVGAVDLGWDAEGVLYVVYSVPVNEKRGIYLLQSKDHGVSWSKPLQVFDGAAADFDIVGAPSLLTLDNGSLHIMWKHQLIQGDGVPESLSLYYSRSEDGGVTFSDATLLVEEPVTWRKMVADHEGNLHLLWRPEDTTTALWDQISFDGGRSWQFPQGLPDQGMTAAITVDTVGRLHFMDTSSDSLGHWIWDGNGWQTELPLPWTLDSDQEGPVELLAATVNKQGKMLVLLGAHPVEATNTMERVLLYSARTLETTPKQTATEAVSAQTQVSPTTAAATPTPEAKATPVSTQDSETVSGQDRTENNTTSGRIPPLTIALVPVALLLLSVLGLVFRKVTRSGDR